MIQPDIFTTRERPVITDWYMNDVFYKDEATYQTSGFSSRIIHRTNLMYVNYQVKDNMNMLKGMKLSAYNNHEGGASVIKCQLMAISIEKSDFVYRKLSSFNHLIFRFELDGLWKHRFDGRVYSHGTKIGLPMDMIEDIRERINSYRKKD